MPRFEWDLTKAELNARLHGITFEEAESVVGNGLSREEPDFGHSDAEERVKVVGWSSMGRLIVVIVSDAGPRPRIISARRATKRERDAYTSR